MSSASAAPSARDPIGIASANMPALLKLMGLTDADWKARKLGNTKVHDALNLKIKESDTRGAGSDTVTGSVIMKN